MLNLNEAWEKAYREFLLEEESKLNEDIDSVLAELADMNESSKKSLQILAEFYAICDESETLTEDGPMHRPEDEAPAGTTASSFDKPARTVAADSEKVNNVLKNILTSYNQDFDDSNKLAYNPKGYEIVTKISDMKFPKNIIFFIKVILGWIKNVVIYFIAKFINLIRKLVGAQPKELNKDFIKLRLEKIQKIENTTDVKKALGGEAPIRLYRMDELPEKLTEGFFDGVFKDMKEPDPKKERVIVSIDLSKDLFSLRELVDHFYKLFDNAYGSNNEKLFESDDLEIILKVFNDTVESVKNGTINRYSIGGAAVEVSPVNLSVIRDNHSTTVTNVNNLKEAYIRTSAKIKDIAKIITSKELVAISDLGMSFQTLSAATYGEMNSLVSTVPERMKEAKELEKKLSKMQKEYEALVSKLSKLQAVSAQISNISYDTIYNRRLQELLTSAKYMTDIVTLRLTALGLYIKELKDVEDILKMLANISGRSNFDKIFG